MKITVYFVDNQKAVFDVDKVSFMRSDGFCFNLTDTSDGIERTYAELVADGKVLINWDNVCFVKEAPEPGMDDDL